MRCASLLLLLFAAISSAQERPKPKIPVGKDTTILLGPLTPEGYIDYAAVVNERLGKGVRPDQNAMVLLVQAFGPQPDGKPAPADFFKLLGVTTPPVKAEYFTGLTDFTRKKKKKLDLDEMIALSDRLRLAIQRPWTAREFPDIADWLTAYEKQVALVVEASKQPNYFCPVIARPDKDGKTGPRLIGGGLIRWHQQIREGSDALLARAMLRTAEGQFDAAWQDLLACQRLARQVGRSGGLIDILIGFVGDIKCTEAILAFLSDAKLTADQLRQFQAGVQGIPPYRSLGEHFEVRGRWETLDWVQANHYLGLADPFPRGDIFGVIGWSIARLLDTDDEKALARASIDWALVFRDQVETADRLSRILSIQDRLRQTEELRKYVNAINARTKAIEPVVTFLNDYLWWLPIEWIRKARSKGLAQSMTDFNATAYLKINEAGYRSEQYERNLRLAFALARFKLAENRYPEKLDELAPKYLDAVPDDVFTSKPMIYKRSPEGYLLYSVGANRKDDGGKTYGDGIGADDLRVRMPMPKKVK